jgi:endonuclease/exonuclease/phosphatase family metal-dependent hydrolase
VAVTALLVHVSSGHRIVVATTHLKSQKLEESGRTEQMNALMFAVRECYGAELLDPQYPASLLLVGDLNSQPRWGLLSALKCGCGPLQMPLHEVYTDFEALAFEDTAYTCFMPHTQQQIDYVLHSPSLRPVACWQVPSDREVVRLHQRDCGYMKLSLEMLPTPAFPSDHVPLWVAFALPGGPGRSCDGGSVVEDISDDRSWGE